MVPVAPILQHVPAPDAELARSVLRNDGLYFAMLAIPPMAGETLLKALISLAECSSDASETLGAGLFCRFRNLVLELATRPHKAITAWKRGKESNCMLHA